MKVFLFIGLIVLTLVTAAPMYKRAAYELAASSEQLVGDIRTTFVCSNDGYYADQDSFCQIFHICHTVVLPDGTFEMIQSSFACGNNTIFNQFSFTCTNPEDVVPCESAENFWYLNANIGVSPNVPIHNDQDAAKAIVLIYGRAAHPLKPEHIVHSSRPSTPNGAIRQSYTMTPAPRQNLRPAVWPQTDRVPLPQPPIRQRIGLTPPRPNMHPMTVPPSPLLLSPITVTRAPKAQYFHVQQPPPIAQYVHIQKPLIPKPVWLPSSRPLRWTPPIRTRPSPIPQTSPNANERSPIPQNVEIQQHLREPPEPYVHSIMLPLSPGITFDSLIIVTRPPIPQDIDIQ